MDTYIFVMANRILPIDMMIKERESERKSTWGELLLIAVAYSCMYEGNYS